MHDKQRHFFGRSASLITSPGYIDASWRTRSTISEIQRAIKNSVRNRFPGAVMPNAKETVLALYRAFQDQDPDLIAALLHEDVVWVAPPGNATQVALGLGRPEEAGAPNGSNNLRRDEIVSFMAHNFARFFGRAKNEFRCVASEGDIVLVEHRLSARLPNGRDYVNDYCFVFEVRDQKVIHMREYMDTRGGWVQVFGESEPRQLLEFVSA